MEPSMKQKKQRTDSGFAWVIVLMSFCTQFSICTNVLSLGILLPDFLEHFQVSKATVGFLGAVKMTACDITGGTIVGPLTRRFGCRPLAVVGFLLAAFGTLAAAFASNFYFLLATYSVLPGIAISLIFIPSNVIVHQYHNQRRALASSLASVGLSLGTMLTPLIFRLASHYLSWRGALMVGASILMQATVAAMMFMPNPDLNRKKPGQQESDPKTDEENNCVADKKKSKKCVDLSLFRNPAFLVFLLGHPFADSAMQVFSAFSIQRAIAQGIDPLSASVILTSFGVCSFCGRISAGFIGSMKCTRRNWQASANIVAAGLISILSIFCGNSLLLHSLASAAYGLQTGSFHSLYSTLLVDLLGVPSLAKAMGLVQMVKCIASLVSLPLAGFLIDATGDYIATYIGVGVAMFVTALTVGISGEISKRARKIEEDIPVS